MTFTHLKGLSVADKSAWYSMPQVAPGARVRVNFAGNDNPVYLESVLRDSARRSKELKKLLESGASAAVMAEHMSRNRKAMGEVLLQEWKGILDEHNKPVEFSREKAIEFVAALPDWLFDRLFRFAENPENFTDMPTPPPTDDEVRELAGN